MVETGYLAEMFVQSGSLPFVFLAANGMISYLNLLGFV